MSQTFSAAAGGFGQSTLSTDEVQRLESFLVPLTESVRALVDATIRTTVDEAVIRAVQVRVDEATALLRRSQLPGPAGVHFNAEGYSWEWGNAATGLRNAAAPPMRVQDGDDGLVYAELDLTAAQEGPPAHLHGGVAALLLDHLMGHTASAMSIPTVTGTLTLRYRRPCLLGNIRIEGRIDRREGYKTFVRATIADEQGVTVEAEGVFIMPRWAREHFPIP